MYSKQKLAQDSWNSKQGFCHRSLCLPLKCQRTWQNCIKHDCRQHFPGWPADNTFQDGQWSCKVPSMLVGTEWDHGTCLFCLLRQRSFLGVKFCSVHALKEMQGQSCAETLWWSQLFLTTPLANKVIVQLYFTDWETNLINPNLIDPNSHANTRCQVHVFLDQQFVGSSQTWWEKEWLMDFPEIWLSLEN